MTQTLGVKIVLLGDVKVGKTRLAHVWSESPNEFNFGSTIGINHFNKISSYQNYDVMINLLDTAGQEQFRSLSPMYVRGSSVVLVVASIDDRETFQNLDFYLKLIQENCSNSPKVFLIVNKIDLEHELSEDEIRQDYQDKFENEIYFVSALTQEGVKEMFNNVEKVALEITVQVNKAATHANIQKKKKDDSCC